MAIFFNCLPPLKWQSIMVHVPEKKTVCELQHDKTNKMSVRPAKTHISLGIRPVWLVFAVHSMGS